MNVTGYTYDALNRVTSKSQNGTQVAAYWYDRTWPGGIPNFLGDNAIGRLNYMWTAAPVATQRDDQYFSYDAMGRPTQWAESSPSEAYTTGHTAQAHYDLAGNMISLDYPYDVHQSGPDLTIAQTFDAAGRLSSVYPAGSPQTPYVASISYLPSGTPDTVTYGNGVVEKLSENNRLQPCESYAMLPPALGGTAVFDRQYSYLNGAASPRSTGSPCPNEAGNNGNVWHVMDATNTAATPSSALRNQDFTYDALNRLSSFSTGSMGGQPRGQNFNYDSFGNILDQTSLVAPASNAADPLSFHATYDAGNHIVTGLNCHPMSAPGQYPWSPRISNIGSSSFYDAAGNQQCSGTEGADARAYVWDPESRVAEVWGETYNNTYAKLAAYTYDANGNRIRADQLGPDGQTPQSWREYSFFAGQMLAEKDQSGNRTNYIYANGKKVAKIASAAKVVHEHGVQQQAGGYTNWWIGSPSPQNLMPVHMGDIVQFDAMYTTSTPDSSISVHMSNGTWLGIGGETPDGLWHHYQATIPSDGYLDGIATGTEGAMPVGPWDAYYANITVQGVDGSVYPVFTGSTLQAVPINNLYETDQSIAVEPYVGNDPALSTTYYLADHLGTTQMELSNSGAPLWRGDFAPFGQELDSQPTSMRFKFTGKERDTESGLDNFGARYYGSNMGRFVSPDPSGLSYADPTNPQSLNLYSYVLNNPLKFTDPSGLECVWDDGSFDSAGDKQTGSHAGCSAQGGTYVDPKAFSTLGAGDWSNKANSDIAAVANALNGSNNFTNVSVNANGSGYIDQTGITLSGGVPYIVKNDYSWKPPLNQQYIQAIAAAAPTICGGGVFAYGGRSLDAGVANGFGGGIVEADTRSGVSKGALFEGGGGEGVVGGAGHIVSSDGGGLGSSSFIYGGPGVEVPFAHAGAGLVGFTNGAGAYGEISAGGREVGVGAYLNITSNAGCHR